MLSSSSHSDDAGAGAAMPKAPAGESSESTLKITQEDIDFLKEHGVNLDQQKKLRKRLERMQPAAFASYKMQQTVSKCMKEMNLRRAIEAYNTARKEGIKIGQDSLHALLSLAAGLGEQGSNLGPPRTEEPPSDYHMALTLFKDMKTAGTKLTESCYTAIIRTTCIHDEDASKAHALYEEMKSLNINPKNRTMSPLLARYSDMGGVQMCFSLYNEMLNKYKLDPTEKDYLNMLRVCTKLHDERFYSVLHDFQEHLLISSKKAWPVFRQWFVNTGNYVVCLAKPTATGDVYIQYPLVPHTSSSSSSSSSSQHKFEINEGEDGWWEEDGKFYDVQRANSSSTSSGDGCKLHFRIRSIDLEEQHRTALLQQIEEIALERANHRKPWLDFKTTLATYMADDSSNRKNLLIDGANVGFFKQNYVGAPSHIEYRQLEWMLRSLQKCGYNPLIVLHCRHLFPQRLPANCVEMTRKWTDEKDAFITPTGANDDWFWLYAAVSLKCCVVTNDLMRDHHFQMLGPRYFPRWRERHVVNFNFGSWVRPGAAAIAVGRKRIRQDYTSDDEDDSDDDVDDVNTHNKNITEKANEEVLTNYVDCHGQHVQPTKKLKIGSYKRQQSPHDSHSMRQPLINLPSIFSRRMQKCPDTNAYFFPAEGSDLWLVCFPKPHSLIATTSTLLKSEPTLKC